MWTTVIIKSIARSDEPTGRHLDRVSFEQHAGYRHKHHQAIAYDETSSFHIFFNIACSQPLIGSLRFAAPGPLAKSRLKPLDNGSGSRMCPQATPGWRNNRIQFQHDYAGDSDTNSVLKQRPSRDEIFPQSPNSERQLRPVEPEYCLYPDVLVPRNV